MNDNSNRAPQEHENARVETASVIVNVRVLEYQIDQERIARRAYEIYESRYRVEGHADDDWFQAAAEYAARLVVEPAPGYHYGASSSFGDRIRNAHP
jgi:hypothetical protein